MQKGRCKRLSTEPLSSFTLGPIAGIIWYIPRYMYVADDFTYTIFFLEARSINYVTRNARVYPK